MHMTPSVEAEQGLRAAWAWWWSLLLAPWVAVLAGAWFFGLRSGVRWSLCTASITLVAVLWLAMGAPAAMVLRSHCLRATWRGAALPADKYLRGMLTIWAALTIGILLSVAGALATRTLLPCLAPAAMAWVWLAVLAPSDRAVLR